ncbi:MAG TPA: acetylglutamate kinase [Candidatus Binataceae bacterium]|nr:acetylglutamate kinase [Candidatus Binataceae bacterium]
MQKLIDRAQTLIEALPYIQRFRGATFVIKYGGHAMESPELREGFARDVVLLKLIGVNPVIVHGGGPQISEFIAKLGIKSQFVRGMRITDAPTMEAVEMVLQRINKDLVALITRQGGRAAGICGKDGALLRARKMEMVVKENGRATRVDVGLVGDVVEVNDAIVRALCDADFIPVIAPVGFGSNGETYNINADIAAGKIAESLRAEKLILLSDVEGVKDKDGRLIATLGAAQARKNIERGVIHEGMIPKVECALDALRGGVAKAHILDGRLSHAVLLEIFTESGVGTEVTNNGAGAPATNGAKANVRRVQKRSAGKQDEQR